MKLSNLKKYGSWDWNVAIYIYIHIYIYVFFNKLIVRGKHFLMIKLSGHRSDPKNVFFQLTSFECLSILQLNGFHGYEVSLTGWHHRPDYTSFHVSISVSLKDMIRPRVLISKPAKDSRAPPLWTDRRGYEKQHLLSSFQAPFRNKHPWCYLHPCAGVDRDRYISD